MASRAAKLEATNADFAIAASDASADEIASLALDVGTHHTTDAITGEVTPDES